MENLVLRQIVNATTGEVNINVVGLKIRNNESRFHSDSHWISHLRAYKDSELFMR
jgi:ABC-type transport system involved in cytochrome c biogenesis ATPase subunit